MRRDDKNRDDNSKGKVKFRFVEFELEGSNATLQESLRNIAASITRGSHGTPTARTLDMRLPAPVPQINYGHDDL